ncbi:MAG: ribosome maturation factor RimM [Acidobacteriota bacterium]
MATGLRLRGARGRLTATLVPGGVDQLSGRGWVLIGRAGGVTARHQVEDCATYGNKVVLKLEGIGSAEAARPVVGLDILMPCNRLVDLPEGTYYIFELVGLRVATRDGRELGTVRDVLDTGGTPLLVVVPEHVPEPGERSVEVLVPAARSICTAIEPASGRITIDPPEGLLELYGI